MGSACCYALRAGEASLAPSPAPSRSARVATDADALTRWRRGSPVSMAWSSTIPRSARGRSLRLPMMAWRTPQSSCAPTMSAVGLRVRRRFAHSCARWPIAAEMAPKPYSVVGSGLRETSPRPRWAACCPMATARRWNAKGSKHRNGRRRSDHSPSVFAAPHTLWVARFGLERTSGATMRTTPGAHRQPGRIADDANRRQSSLQATISYG